MQLYFKDTTPVERNFLAEQSFRYIIKIAIRLNIIEKFENHIGRDNFLNQPTITVSGLFINYLVGTDMSFELVSEAISEEIPILKKHLEEMKRQILNRKNASSAALPGQGNDGVNPNNYTFMFFMPKEDRVVRDGGAEAGGFINFLAEDNRLERLVEAFRNYKSRKTFSVYEDFVRYNHDIDNAHRAAILIQVML